MKKMCILLLSRTVWLKVHLYIALSVGFLFALIGLSGSLSIYRTEIYQLFNPSLVIEKPQGQYQSLDKIIDSVRAAHPDRHGSWTLEMPNSPTSTITAWFDKPTETFFELYAPLMVSVNPYTSEVIMSRFWGQTLTTWLMDLHTQLHFDRLGWNTVGILGFFLCVSCISGLYLWWPSLTQLFQLFKLKTNQGLMKLAYDLHRLLGILTTIPLLVLSCTGILLSFPATLELFTGSSGMEHGQTGKSITSTAIPNNHPTGLAAATFVAQGLFPKAQLRRVTTPTGDSGVYRINLRQNSEVNKKHPFTTVWVDRWSGQIKEVRNPTQFSGGETLATWIWPLHTGETLGSKGRFIWFLSGMSLFVLYISGLLRWLCRTHKMQDKDIDITPLKYFLSQQTKKIISITRVTLDLLITKAKIELPELIKIATIGVEWLKKIISNSVNKKSS